MEGWSQRAEMERVMARTSAAVSELGWGRGDVVRGRGGGCSEVEGFV